MIRIIGTKEEIISLKQEMEESTCCPLLATGKTCQKYESCNDCRDKEILWKEKI